MKADFSRRRSELVEQMDDARADREHLFRTYEQFDGINQRFAGWHDLYRRWIRPRLSRDRTFTLLDIGCGGGDIIRHLHEWSAADGFAMEFRGIDPDPRAIDFVTSKPWPVGIVFETATARQLVERGDQFDFVISNSVLHHLSDDEVVAFARQSHQLARKLVLHNDLARSRVAWCLFRIWAGLCYRQSFSRKDGLISIQRSYRADELQRLLGADWNVRASSAFHLMAMRAR